MNIHIINFYAEVCFDLVPNDLGARAGVVFFATDVLLDGVFWVPSVLEPTVCELSEVKSEGVCSVSSVDCSAGWISFMVRMVGDIMLLSCSCEQDVKNYGSVMYVQLALRLGTRERGHFGGRSGVAFAGE